jgi:hypothetical protein
LLSFLFELGTRSIADGRCRLACMAASTVGKLAKTLLLSSDGRPSTGRPSNGRPSNNVVARTVAANLPHHPAPVRADATCRTAAAHACTPAATATGARLPPTANGALASNELFALWTVAGVPELLVPGRTLMSTDDLGACSLVRFSPLTGVCLVFAKGR